MKIKRLLYIAVTTVITLGISNNSVAQNVSHTFVVDGNLPAPKEKFSSTKGDVIASVWANEEKTGKVIATSWGEDNMYYPGHSTFFYCLVQAYANHYSLILSPDIIWTVISQGFSQYVNQDPEALRDRIVSHEGKMTLAVETQEDIYSPNVKWDEILDGFDKQIAENTKGNIADMMRADFSTTGKTERIASQITLMSSVKAYFDFEVLIFSCGIPSITIEGTPEDWQKVMEKTENLRKYDLGWWVDDLTPILNEFVLAAEGKANRVFWQNIVMKLRPDEFREGGGCSSDIPTEVDGWFLKLMPFDKNGRTPQKVAYDTEDMLPNVASVPFTYEVLDELGNTISSTPMDMVAGLVGVDVDYQANTVRPRIGWMVCESSKSTFEEQLVKSDGLQIKNSVPEELRQIKYLPYLDITFANELRIPDWMDSLKIDRIYLNGKISPQMKKELQKYCSNRDIKIKEGDWGCGIDSKTCQMPDDYVFPSRYLRYQDEKWPNYPAKFEKFYEYIEKNRRIPASENNKKDKSKGGRVIWVEFTIEKDGSVSDVKIEKNVNIKEECEEEALRLVREMPKWQPAKKKINGIEKTIRCRESEAIMF